MRLTVPQIADVPQDLHQEVDRAIDADLIEEGFARVARVLNGGIGPENLAPGFAFAAADFLESKGIYQLTTQYVWSGAFVNPTLIPLGTVDIASTLTSVRLTLCTSPASWNEPTITVYSASGGAGVPVAPDLVGTRIDPFSGESPGPTDPTTGEWLKYGNYGELPAPKWMNYSISGAWAVAAGKMLYLQIAGAGVALRWVTGMATLKALHQS